jgi:hypothetical protein
MKYGPQERAACFTLVPTHTNNIDCTLYVWMYCPTVEEYQSLSRLINSREMWWFHYESRTRQVFKFKYVPEWSCMIQ